MVAPGPSEPLTGLHEPHGAVTGSRIADALASVRMRIALACERSGRGPAEIGLVAVSKFQPVAAVEQAVQAGQMWFGENRVQEAEDKFGVAPRADGRRLHLIGALQTNKVRDAVRIADVIETLDRPKLADAIERAADQEGRLPELLIQVNVGDETQKAGIAPGEADRFIGRCMRRFGGRVRGLMCIPPVNADPRPHFRALAELARANGLSTLSMGMSDDLETAIEEGSSEVRVGTAIFGARPGPTFNPGPA